jgi:CMP-N,N'-diacetyllegionaminic acid synthase
VEVLAVIHARGGSKRIPLKNLAVVGGKPLLAYPILLAKASQYITRVVVSTDHDGIMEEARRWDAEVPFRRPSDISEDVPSELVTIHAIDFLRDQEGYVPDMVITLTPATPFTRPEQVDEGVSLLEMHPDWDSVVTVRRATEYPEWLMRKRADGLFEPVLGNPLDGDYNVSQNLRPAFYPSGAFFINRPETLRCNKGLYGQRFGAVVLDSRRVIDIDTPDDLRQANELVATLDKISATS